MNSVRDYEELFLKNNSIRLEKILSSKANKCYFLLHPKLRKLYRIFIKSNDLSEKNKILTGLLNSYEESFLWRVNIWRRCTAEDIKKKHDYGRGRIRIDKGDPNVRDYYSVALIVKNESRYIREYILFYKATGADRIYLYDNDSTDNLMEEIEPFVKSGFVVYQKWPGQVVQCAAYRDVIRKTRHRTKWLALVDADEFLFSPKGDMKPQLKVFESYPGVCVDWRMFGPSGHDARPEGLIMDNYTTTIADEDNLLNRHVKSIVQPAKVFTMFHPHFAIYKCREYAVDEKLNVIDNSNAFYPNNSRAFTSHNHSDIFRINHYYTKSLQDLREKCSRGYPDGQPNRDYDDALQKFECPLKEDTSIRIFADKVRKDYY